VSTPEQIIARVVDTAGSPAEQAAWLEVEDELIALRMAERAMRDLIDTLAGPAAAGTSVPADAVRRTLQAGLQLRDAQP
jgi:hypothetical protein